jgi:hypothetical protein
VRRGAGALAGRVSDVLCCAILRHLCVFSAHQLLQHLAHPNPDPSPRREVTQWSRAEYRGASNKQQDDIALIAKTLPLLPDDVGSNMAAAAPIAPGAPGRAPSGSQLVSLPASLCAPMGISSPAHTHPTSPQHTGVPTNGLMGPSDARDVFAFTTYRPGMLTVQADVLTPWRSAASGRVYSRSNLSLRIALVDAAAKVRVASACRASFSKVAAGL